jgi:hypothetical protein
MDSLLIKEFIALNPKVYSIKHQEINEENKQIYIKNKKALKGVSKAVVKNCIDHQDFIDTKLNNVPLKGMLSVLDLSVIKFIQ